MAGFDSGEIQDSLLANPGQIADSDLVAYLLRGAVSPEMAGETAERVLHSLAGVRGLADFRYERAEALQLAESTAVILLAAFELARRQVLWEPHFAADHDVVLFNRYLRGLFAPGEVLGAIFLGPSRQFLGSLEVFRGRLHEGAFDPKPMLREALALGANGILLAHVEPIQDEVWREARTWVICERAHDACQALGIELVDYRILGACFVSLRSVYR